MRKIPIYFLLFAGLVAVHAHDMDAMKYFNLGISSSITKKIKYFTEALKLNPGLEAAFEKRGLFYYFQEKYDKQPAGAFLWDILIFKRPKTGLEYLGAGLAMATIYSVQNINSVAIVFKSTRLIMRINRHRNPEIQIGTRNCECFMSIQQYS